METKFKLGEQVWLVQNNGSRHAELNSESVKYVFVLMTAKVMEITHKFVNGKPSVSYTTDYGFIISDFSKGNPKWVNIFKTKDEAMAFIKKEYPIQVQRELEFEVPLTFKPSKRDIHHYELSKAGKTELVIENEEGEVIYGK